MKTTLLVVAAFVAGAKLMNDIKDIEFLKVSKARAQETFDMAYDLGYFRGQQQKV